jgi:hypothetical protein
MMLDPPRGKCQQEISICITHTMINTAEVQAIYSSQRSLGPPTSHPKEEPTREVKTETLQKKCGEFLPANRDNMGNTGTYKSPEEWTEITESKAPAYNKRLNTAAKTKLGRVWNCKI